jgi:hypothetical protein
MTNREALDKLFKGKNFITDVLTGGTHGHVRKGPVVARCGGPFLCLQCAFEQAYFGGDTEALAQMLLIEPIGQIAPNIPRIEMEKSGDGWFATMHYRGDTICADGVGISDTIENLVKSFRRWALEYVEKGGRP